MTKLDTMKLVEEAIAIDRTITELDAELKRLKEDLVAAALKRQGDQVETDGGGWSVVLEGSAGNIARVTQPGPKLKSVIDGEKPAGAKILELVGSKFKDQLFTPRLTYVPTENFRVRAEELLTPGVAARVIKGCETKSAVAVSFETKDGN